jgi:glycosyltransferase involved in cell wall biosynthesis
MRILLATDAWHPQINGVVVTLTRTMRELQRMGHHVKTITPDLFPNMAFPWYQEIRLSMPSVEELIEDFQPDHIHIATEGPIGLSVRHVCNLYSYKFTTSYHTDFPSYVKEYLGVPQPITYQFLKWFHQYSHTIMVATQTVRYDLEAHGFQRIAKWSRGVDLDLFRPLDDVKNQRPVLVYVGRVAIEKNIEAFLDLPLPYAKRVVGGGPMLEPYRGKYPAVEFTGPLKGEKLVEKFASADAFVFPSKTDTFGLVVLEALACGLPVAAYPTPGPLEVLTHPSLGMVHDDLATAVEHALAHGDRSACRRHALNFSWNHCTEQFLHNLTPARPIFGHQTQNAASGAGRA